MDIFFVKKIAFLHTKSDKINFRSIQRLNTRKMSEIVKGVKIVKAKYQSRNIKIEKWHVDNEFDCDELREIILPASMEVYARNEHVGVIEQSTKTVKNRTRSTCAGLPYTYYPIIMIKELVAGVIYVMNRLITLNDMFRGVTPESKMDASTKHIVFGSYAEIYWGDYE